MATSLFGTEEFTEQERSIIRRLLEQKLGDEHLASRPGAGGGN
jgi:recombination DNA repair RAD52 pathway protein